MNTHQSILNPRLYGVISITGPYGVGKTTLSITAEHPKLTAMVDFDLKFKEEAAKLGIWYRSPDKIEDVFNFDLPGMATWFKSVLAEIPDGTTVVTIDNASQLEAILGHIVSLSPEKYGVSATNAKSGSYGGVNPGVGRLWKNITLYLQKKGVKVIFVVSHVGSPWIDGKPVLNKFRGKGNKAIQELSNLSLVLVRQTKPYPAAVILKEQFAQRVFTENGWEIKRVLPLRFPRAEWTSMLSYFDNPADFEKPKAGEVPTQAEIDMFGELFSKQQIEFIKAVANGQYVEDGDAPQFVPTESAHQPFKPEPAPTPQPEPNGKDTPPSGEKPYKFPSTAAQNFYNTVQQATGNYYNSPHHLLKVIGSWFNFASQDLWEEKLSMAIDHAQMKVTQ